MYVAYDGSAYHGWQSQPNGTSVQEVVEKSLSTLLRCPIGITAAGRTDAGVNATNMPVHFDYNGVLPIRLPPHAEQRRSSSFSTR